MTFEYLKNRASNEEGSMKLLQITVKGKVNFRSVSQVTEEFSKNV